MREKKDRIVIDTNLWISFLLTKSVHKLDRFFTSGSVILIFSEELLEEFLEVTNRPKFKKYFSVNDLEDLLFQIRLHAEFVKVTSFIEICRDPKDNFLLSLAKDGKANFLITGDKDLLELVQIGKTSILTITQFLHEKGTTP